MIETITPANRQHWLEMKTKDVSSTESAALFGLSPWTTEFELWHAKRDATVVEIEQNDRMKWGTRLQDSIANGIAEDMGWNIRKMDEYIRDPDLRMGSSFDFAISDDALLEIKNVDAMQFKERWLINEDGELEAPTSIEVQIQHQLAVSNRQVAFVGALVGGNTVKLIERERDESVIEAIRARVKKFWSLVDQGTPPPPDFQRDASFIASLYKSTVPGSVLDKSDDQTISHLMDEYRAHSDAEKMAKSGKDAIKARILMQVGEAEKVLGNGFSISMGTTKASIIERHERAGYRQFRPYFKK